MEKTIFDIQVFKHDFIYGRQKKKKKKKLFLKIDMFLVMTIAMATMQMREHLCGHLSFWSVCHCLWKMEILLK